ncbi:MAG: DUF4214 domain-containing protein [Lachnospiraceae bacterium]|nr:DUF4214 domain-containing protein [Lachnospiraceae bacterium]
MIRNTKASIFCFLFTLFLAASVFFTENVKAEERGSDGDPLNTETEQAYEDPETAEDEGPAAEQAPEEAADAADGEDEDAEEPSEEVSGDITEEQAAEDADEEDMPAEYCADEETEDPAGNAVEADEEEAEGPADNGEDADPEAAAEQAGEEASDAEADIISVSVDAEAEDIITDAAAEDIIPEEQPAEEELAVKAEEPADSAADGAATFVDRCYRVILGRAPDEGGLAYWTEKLRTGGKTASDIMKGFFASSEFTGKNYSDSKYIEILYKAALGRSVDSTGLANRLQEREYGFTRNYLLKYVTGSSEFKNKCSALSLKPGTVTLTDTLDLNPNETKYVYSLYQNILGRKPDRKGQVSNVTALKEKGARPLVVKFFRAGEYTKKKTSDEQFIQDVFMGCLRRSAESGAVTNRINMMNNGLSRMYVLKNVLSASEFENKTVKWKVEAGTFPDDVLENRDINTKLTKFVLLAYQNGLSRNPSASELNNACGPMLSGERKAFDQLHRIIFSAEGKKKTSSDEAFVKTAFKLTIQRAPTSSELTFYKDLLGGLRTREEVFDRLVFGDEGVKTAKKYGFNIKDKYSDMYDKAAQLLDSVGWDLKAAYDWICTKEWSKVGVYDEEPSRWHADYFFDNDTGDCYAMAGAFYEMAKLTGYDAHQMAGHVVFRSGALGKHSWVEIDIKGATYIVDPDTEVEVGLNAWFVYYGQSGTLQYAEYERMN